jgi:hypothetical protein
MMVVYGALVLVVVGRGGGSESRVDGEGERR